MSSKHGIPPVDAEYGMTPQFLRALWTKYHGASPLTTLWRLYDGQHGNILLALVFFVMKHSPVWVWPILLSNVINALVERGDGASRRVWMNMLCMLVLVLQNIPSHTLYTYLLGRSIRDMQMRLRSLLVLRIQQLSIAFHSNFQSGRLQSKMLRDVDAVEMLSRHGVDVVVSGVLSLVVAIGVAVYNKPVMALFFLVTVPAAVGLLQVFRHRMDTQNREYRKAVEHMTSMVAEMMEMIPITRAHGAEGMEVRKFSGHFRQLREKGLRLDVLNALFGSSFWVVSQLFTLMCLAVTSVLVFRSVLKPGDVVMYMGFFSMLVLSVNGIVMIYPQLSQGRESIRSIGEILECPDIERNEGKKAVKEVRGEVEFKSVEYRYTPDMPPAVSGADLRIAPGECVAFVGESGSGKSTLMNLVIGFRRPTSGKILLDGWDSEEIDMRTYRQFVAVVPQNTILFSGTIRDNVTYGLNAVDDVSLARVLEMANVTSFLRDLPEGMETKIGEHGGKLSGGQRQRIAIARALIRNPRVIVLDEPTSALDVVSERFVQEAMETLIKGRTTLIVAHRLSTIRNADRVVVMKAGRIVETGRHDDLVARQGEFYKLKVLQG